MVIGDSTKFVWTRQVADEIYIETCGGLWILVQEKLIALKMITKQWAWGDKEMKMALNVFWKLNWQNLLMFDWPERGLISGTDEWDRAHDREREVGEDSRINLYLRWLLEIPVEM